MRIKVISDNHNEFHADKGKGLTNSIPNDCDPLIIAGDLSTLPLLGSSLKAFCDRFPKVIYVLGNHEYYGYDFNFVNDYMANVQSKISNLYWLENKRITIDSQGFIGTTLWFEETPWSKDMSLKDRMNDFSMIKNCDPIAFHKYDEAYRFLKSNTQKGDVVVTHHMPSFKCVDKIYKKSLLNVYFASDADKIIEENEPKLFVSGHTHIPYDFMIGNTRMLCNAFGYIGEQNLETDTKRKFNENLLIEI